MGQIQFVIGGARSGKSAFAEKLAMASFNAMTGDSVDLFYLATAQAFDDEMQKRIDLHQQRRNEDWQTIDAPLDLPEKLQACGHENSTILIDCLSIWTTNLLIADAHIDAARSALLDAVTASPANLVVVASETGLGIVPDTPLSRKFRDSNGLTNQMIAAVADDVYFMVAAIAQKIKP